MSSHTPKFRRLLVLEILRAIQLLLISLLDVIKTVRKDPIPYHTSVLSGYHWLLELLTGHPERIRCELGVHKEVFLQLVEEFRSMGLTDSRNVTLEEQVAICLYTCVTGLTTRHVGERFQRSNETITRYFKKIIKALSTPPFYTSYVLPATGLAVPPQIRQNSKFWPFFRHAIGAIDGSHIPVSPPAAIHERYRNRKGFPSQNALFVADFDMQFTYMLTGWEGSATDARVYDDAISTDLHIPDGKYLLADAGYPLCLKLLVPYRGVRYHLAEWGRASIRPANREELFNLRHSSARNVIERIFGVLKQCFHILLLPTEYDLKTQAQIPAALCALHNFILTNHDNPQDTATSDSNDEAAMDDNESVADQDANVWRNNIAQAMWDSYQAILAARECEGLDDSWSDFDMSDADMDLIDDM